MNENPTRPCSRPFAEELLSGYLDGALPQKDAQRIRLHLEDCPTCHTLYTELSTLRQAALTTQFKAPARDQWPELPQTRLSWLSRSLGWTVVLTWLLAVSGFALWRFLAQADNPLEIFLVLGLPGGLALLLGSVLLDRVRELKSDRYRGVHR